MGLLAMGIDWTAVLVTGIPATIAALFSGVALVIVSLNRRTLRTPSGERIGVVAEQASHVASATNASVQQLHQRMNGENVLPLRPDAGAADA